MNRSASALLIVPLLTASLLALPEGGRAQDDSAPNPAATPAEEPPGARLPYEVELTGVDDDLRGTLNDSSTLVELKNDPPPSLIGLERRAESDRTRLQAALRSAGYYDARLDIKVDAARQPARVSVEVEPGPLYHYKSVTVASASGAPLPGGPADPATLGLGAGEPARGQPVLDAEAGLLRSLATRGYAFAKVADRRVTVDHTDRSMDVVFTIDPGPAVRYGATRIDGLEQVDERLVRGRLPWRPGEPFDPATLDRARQDIAKLEVFDTVRVRLAERPGPDGVTPVEVTVAERKRRFIGAGVSYSTLEGIGANAYWGHRNLLGGAERLRLGVEVGRVAGASGGKSSTGNNLPDLRFSANFRKPDFLWPHQSLVLNFAVTSDQPPAYDRVATELTGALEWQFTDRLTFSYGIGGERGRVRTRERSWQTAFVRIPLGLAWNGTDDLLNPAKGERASLQVTPALPAGGDTERPFTAVQFNGSVYHDFGTGGRYVGAARVGVGSIVGATLDQIPPDHRFYAGGGGSVRGYGFQKAGPRNRFNEPTGGRSLFEAGVEMRIKVTDSIGIVPFLDAGSVYDSALPDFSQTLRLGAGLGARYYTDFGPLRVDVGVPLNQSRGDARWQLYLSLGQAF